MLFGGMKGAGNIAVVAVLAHQLLPFIGVVDCEGCDPVQNSKE